MTTSVLYTFVLSPQPIVSYEPERICGNAVVVPDGNTVNDPLIGGMKVRVHVSITDNGRRPGER